MNEVILKAIEAGERANALYCETWWSVQVYIPLLIASFFAGVGLCCLGVTKLLNKIFDA